MSAASSRSAGATRTRSRGCCGCATGDRIEIVDSAATAFCASIDRTGRVVRATLLEAHRRGSRRLQRSRSTSRRPCRRDGGWSSSSRRAPSLERTPSFRSIASAASARAIGRGETRALATPCAQRRAAERQARRSRDTRTLQFDALLERFDEYDAVLFAWELAPPAPLRERLLAALPAAGRVLVVVGPEGGFTHDEAEVAARHGAALLSLGRRILRTDTAAVALLAVIGALAS